MMLALLKRLWYWITGTMEDSVMDYAKRSRIAPRVPPHLMNQLRQRMSELGHHRDQHMHLGPLTWLFVSRGWILVSKSGSSQSALYPPDKTMGDVLSELGDW